MNKKGFTLLELIIVLGIMGVVMSLVSTFFFLGFDSLNKTEKELDIQRELKKVVAEVELAGKSANDFMETSSAGKKIYGFDSKIKVGNDYGRYAVVFYEDEETNELYLIREELDNLGEENSNQPTVFDRELIESLANNGIRIAEGVDSFNIIQSGSVIEVEIALKKSYKGEDIIQEYTSEFIMRNKVDE